MAKHDKCSVAATTRTTTTQQQYEFLVLEARSEQDKDELWDMEVGTIEAAYKILALSDKGEEALQRGYIKKLSAVFDAAA